MGDFSPQKSAAVHCLINEQRVTDFWWGTVLSILALKKLLLCVVRLSIFAFGPFYMVLLGWADPVKQAD